MQCYWLTALIFLTAVPLADFTAPLVQWDDMRVKHTWHTIPTNWESLGHPSADLTIDLYIALKPKQESALVDALYEVSDPRQPRHARLTTLPPALYSRVPLLLFRYRKFLSKEHVAELVRPYPEALELIHAWLVHHGVQSSSISMTHGGAWLTVTARNRAIDRIRRERTLAEKARQLEVPGAAVAPPTAAPLSPGAA